MNDESERTGSRVATSLLEIRRRIRLAVGTRGALVVLAACAGVAILSLLVDRFFRLGVPARTVLLVLYVAALTVYLVKVLWRPLAQPLGAATVADLLERQRPELRDLLRSAVDFARELDHGTPADGPAGEDIDNRDLETALKRRVVERAEELSAELRDVPLVNRTIVGRSIGGALGGLVAVSIAFWGLPLAALWPVFLPSDTAAIWFRRNVLLASDVEWPYRTRLLLESDPSDALRVPRGDPLEIRVRVVGEVPARAWIHVEYSRDRRRFSLERSDERTLRYVHPEVREPFEFRLQGGDYRSPAYRVEVLERPRLDLLRITRFFPDYIGSPPKTTEGASGELSVPEGTRLRLEGAVSKPLSAASLGHPGGETPITVDGADPRRFTVEVKPKSSGGLTLRFEDREGVRPQSPPQIHVRLIPDRLPTVKLRAVDIGHMVSPEARIPLVIEASDDYRIDEMKILHTIIAEPTKENLEEGEEPHKIEGATPIADFEPTTPVALTPVFEVRDHAIEPESRLTIQAAAVDSDTLEGPKTGVSAVVEFLVVTPEKLMDDFLRRQEEQHRAFERQTRLERKVRDALYEAMDGGLRRGGELAPEVAAELAAHSRQQRTIATQSLAVAAALEAILKEMVNNRVGEADDLQRLGRKVVDPLRQLAAEDLPRLDADFEALRKNSTAETRAADRIQEALELAEAVEETLDRMDAILANMVKLEGFTEIVNQLRSIIGLQGESRDAARAAYDKLLNSIFVEDEVEDDAENGADGAGER